MTDRETLNMHTDVVLNTGGNGSITITNPNGGSSGCVHLPPAVVTRLKTAIGGDLPKLPGSTCAQPFNMHTDGEVVNDKAASTVTIKGTATDPSGKVVELTVTISGTAYAQLTGARTGGPQVPHVEPANMHTDVSTHPGI